MFNWNSLFISHTILSKASFLQVHLRVSHSVLAGKWRPTWKMAVILDLSLLIMCFKNWVIIHMNKNHVKKKKTCRVCISIWGGKTVIFKFMQIMHISPAYFFLLFGLGFRRHLQKISFLLQFCLSQAIFGLKGTWKSNFFLLNIRV